MSKMAKIRDIYKNIRKICECQKKAVSLRQKIAASMEEIKKELREIVNTSARNLTAEQRRRVQEIADKIGVAIPTKTKCNSCWIDTAVQCYKEIEKRTAKADAANEGRKYVLKPNVDLLFGGIRINAATLTDELAERIIARGFEIKYFEKCE